MRTRDYAVVLLALLTAACGRSEESRKYELRGQVIGIQSSRNEITIKHDAVPGLMDGMTMPFTVRDVKELKGRMPGDLVTATLVVSDGAAHLEGITKIGTAPIAEPSDAPPASSGFELLRPGDQVPDVTFTDEAGRQRRISEFLGKAVALTFIYTRCPMPTFCPRMDRNFASIQRSVAGDGRLRGRVHLLSVSFDPAYDTPEVLKAHAASLQANPDTWSFLTGDRDEIDQFAARFGVSLMRDQQGSPDIAHNLRTAVLSPDGKLIKIYSGFDWSPQQVIEDLAAAVTGA
jgi:protein SCO1/2